MARIDTQDEEKQEGKTLPSFFSIGREHRRSHRLTRLQGPGLGILGSQGFQDTVPPTRQLRPF